MLNAIVPGPMSLERANSPTSMILLDVCKGGQEAMVLRDNFLMQRGAEKLLMHVPKCKSPQAPPFLSIPHDIHAAAGQGLPLQPRIG